MRAILNGNDLFPQFFDGDVKYLSLNHIDSMAGWIEELVSWIWNPKG